MHFKRYFIAAVAAALFLAGCQSYAPKPLVPREIIDAVERERLYLDGDRPDGDQPDEDQEGLGDRAEEGGEPFTLQRAAELMSRHSPALREIRAEYESARAVADIKTPWPNPSVESGPTFGSNLGGSKDRWQPYVALGFTIPLSGRLAREDDVNQRAAELAFLGVLVEHRRIYLDLRMAYARWILARARLQAREAITRSLETAEELMSRLVEVGRAGALDVGTLELELSTSRMELLESQGKVARAEGELARLMGIHPRHFSNTPVITLPDLPAALPGLDALQDFLVKNHLNLALLRGEYEKAESELRLEITKQYPDLQLGGSYEGDPGERKKVWGLTLGIDLPIFDRNQQGIAAARAHREEILAKYHAEANRALEGLEQACRMHSLAREKREWIQAKMLPRARSNEELARQYMAAGSMDAFHYLEVEQALNNALIQQVDTELELRETLMEIEKAVGKPLWLFASEEEGMIPSLPETLDQPTRSDDDATAGDDDGTAGEDDAHEETPEDLEQGS